MRSYNKYVIFPALMIFVLSAAGCDMFNSIKESLGGDKAENQKTEASMSAAKSMPVSDDMPANAIAKIGRWVLTKQQFEERIQALKEVVPEFDDTDAEARRLILDELVRQQLLVADAEKNGLDKQKEIDAAVEEFRRSLIVREIANELTQNITVTDEEASAFYEENKDLIVEPPQYRVSEIVVDDRARASELLTEILNGADFATKAKENSKGPTAAEGGDLGFLTEDPFPEMVEAILSLEEGEVSNVLKGPDGFYIVKLTEKAGGRPIPYEEVKEEIFQDRLLFKQQQAILDHLEKLEGEFSVQLNEELLQ